MYWKEIPLILFPLVCISIGIILSVVVDESGSEGIKENSSLIMSQGMLALIQTFHQSYCGSSALVRTSLALFL